MKHKLYLFGGFAKNWSHNQQLLKILQSNYVLIDISHQDRGKFGILGIIKYLIKYFKTAKNITNNSICFVGFNSIYDVVILRLISFIFKKKIKIINEVLVMQYDTYIINKPISKNKYILHYYKVFLYFLDYFTLHFSDMVIFDTSANLNRFSKIYRLNKDKCRVILLCANNDIFFKEKDDFFWQTDKLNILWYGNPSKLHNLEFIKDVISKLDVNKFNCSIIGNMKNMSLEEISKLLQKTHILLGCFGNTDKCTNVVINKEYEALASSTVLITKNGNKEFLKKCVIFCDSEEEVVNNINYFFENRNELIELSNKARNEYIKHCSLNRLSDNYTVLINSLMKL